MASLKNKKAKQHDKFCLDIQFDGVVQSSVRADLLVELIKQILYQRNQLPAGFDQLQQDLQKEVKIFVYLTVFIN